MIIYGSLLCTVGGCCNKRLPHQPYCRKHTATFAASARRREQAACGHPAMTGFVTICPACGMRACDL